MNHAWALAKDVSIFFKSLAPGVEVKEFVRAAADVDAGDGDGVTASPGLGDQSPPQERKRKLAVIIHGLHGVRRNWFAHIKALSERGWDIYTPEVLKGGNCPLAEAAAPIVTYVQSLLFLTEDPLNDGTAKTEEEQLSQPKPKPKPKPKSQRECPYGTVALIGASNGTRLIHVVKASIDWPPEIDLRLISIAGFYSGIPWLNSIHLVLRPWLHASILEEFPSKAPIPLELLDPPRTLYIATRHDTRFIATESSVPPTAVHFAIVDYEGHCSVHYGTLDIQLQFLEIPRENLSIPFRPQQTRSQSQPEFQPQEQEASQVVS